MLVSWKKSHNTNLKLICVHLTLLNIKVEKGRISAQTILHAASAKKVAFQIICIALRVNYVLPYLPTLVQILFNFLD